MFQKVNEAVFYIGISWSLWVATECEMSVERTGSVKARLYQMLISRTATPYIRICPCNKELHPTFRVIVSRAIL